MSYDKYYQTENLFGNPFPELIDFFSLFFNKGKVLDIGCGQGRDAIPLARMGFSVIGLDNSKVGIEQMNRIADLESLNLKGIVANVYAYEAFADFDFILLDSMFHFAKKDKKKEVGFIKTILSKINQGCQMVICIQDTGKKVEILNETIHTVLDIEFVERKKFTYTFEDKESGHQSKTNYQMIVVKKS